MEHRVCRGDPDLGYYLYVPPDVGAGARILVSVHGISERPEHHVEVFAPLAQRYGLVLVAPCFESGVFDDYQRLGRAGLGARADQALERLVAEVASSVGAAGGRFLLFGFSGGAQFAHRYLMAHPSRVVAAAISSAGWYTWPSRRRRFPYGIRESPRLPDLRFDADAFLRVPLLVTVGSDDVERDDTLRRSLHLDRQQGLDRVERARRWVEAMKDSAIQHGLPAATRLHKLPGVDHSFRKAVERGGLAEIVLAFLCGDPRAAEENDTAAEPRNPVQRG